MERRARERGGRTWRSAVAAVTVIHLFTHVWREREPIWLIVRSPEYLMMIFLDSDVLLDAALARDPDA